jgi:hypothetical protein
VPKNESPALTIEAAPTLRVDRARASGLTRWAAAAVAFGPVLGLAIAQGGYFPSAWGWASVPLLWSAAVALVLRTQLRLSRPEVFLLVSLTGFTGWVALSTAWSTAPAESILETERTLVYFAAVLAVLVIARSSSRRHVLGGLLAAISLISAAGLATRLLPDRVGVYDGTGVYRLAEPIGYWNGLALFAAVGIILAAGFAARGRSIAARAGSAALLVVLLPTMYFTYGRGAWLALGVGLLATLAADPRRLQLLVTLIAVSPAAATAAVIASRERGLTHAGSPLALAAHDGHRVALAIVALAAANAAVSAAVALGERRIRIARFARRAFAISVASAAVAVIAAGLVRYGGPVHIAKHAYASFKAPPPHATSNLNSRLLSFSGNGRADLWRLAWDDASRHPALGSGAGTYGRYFLANQSADVGFVRDAHNLYLETLAETGPVGLALLAAVLLSPALVLRRARHRSLVAVAFGAYVAYVVHAAADWDWELPAVTLTALLCLAVILLAGRTATASPPRPVPQPVRWGVAGLAVLVAALATVGLTGNMALSRSRAALSDGDIAAAATDARRARTLMPWSPAPWEALGSAQLQAGLLGDARRSFRKAASIDPGDWQLWSQLAAVTTGRERTHALARAARLAPILAGAR